MQQVPPSGHPHNAPYPGAYGQTPQGFARPPGSVGVQSTRGLATALSVLVPMVAVLSLLGVALDPMEIRVEDQQTTLFQGWMGVLTSIVWVAAAAVALTWAYRVVANARLVGDPTRPSPGWAVGSWFIPLANYVLPFLVLKEAWTKSRVGYMAVFALWWGTWVLAGVISLVGFVWAFSLGFDAAFDGSGSETGVRVIPLPSGMIALLWLQAAAYLVASVAFVLVAWRFEAAQRSMGAYLQQQAAARPM